MYAAWISAAQCAATICAHWVGVPPRRTRGKLVSSQPIKRNDSAMEAGREKAWRTEESGPCCAARPLNRIFIRLLAGPLTRSVLLEKAWNCSNEYLERARELVARPGAGQLQFLPKKEDVMPWGVVLIRLDEQMFPQALRLRSRSQRRRRSWESFGSQNLAINRVPRAYRVVRSSSVVVTRPPGKWRR